MCSSDLAVTTACFTASSLVAVEPLIQAHAHNDYEHPRPLFDALAQGFCSVEADIHWVEDKLLVAHDRKDVKPERTLQALYLEPLRARVRENGGRVFPGGPGFTLLIDVKGNAAQTARALQVVLKEYADVLTEFRDGRVRTNAILVVVTGDQDRAVLLAEPVRLLTLDGKLPDLDGPAPSDVIPWISDYWFGTFKWRGVGPMPADERKKLKAIADRAHAQGRRLRFWGGPDLPAVWAELRSAGVDLINTDRLADLQQFLQSAPPASRGADAQKPAA